MKNKMKNIVYCYETNEKFESMGKAANFAETTTTSIKNALNKSSRSAGGYHWYTDINLYNLSKENKIEVKHITTKRKIYCYETKLQYDSIGEASKLYNIDRNAIKNAVDNPNKMAAGYHWCTDLSIFDGVELTGGRRNKIIYCYETKEKFESINDAAKFYNMNNISILDTLDKPNRTSGDYHWCTDLSIFDGVELTKGIDTVNIKVYCYETKQKFNSMKEAAKFCNLINSSTLTRVINDPTKLTGGYHWCTDLSIFDNVELIYPEPGISNLEKELVDYIKLIYNKEIIENSKSIISPKELDIYIPDLNLAFEFNGDYWHSEAGGKDNKYHVNKTNLCKSKGIQLIHIYEYQWKNNKEVWLSFIANKLKVNTNKIYARKCEVRLVSNEISKEFCDNNHLQKSSNANINLGLYHNNELVSVMTFGKPRFNKDYDYELIRFCNKRFTNVVGGASKLLKYFEVNFKPKSLLSYAEIDYSDGNLYSSLDFKLAVTNKPNYVWVKQDMVLPRYKTMKHKLNELLSNFDSKLTETENMENNGYNKLWKCGTYTFTKQYTN